MYNSMNVCKWCMSGSATENSILLSVLTRLNKIFNQSINQSIYQVAYPLSHLAIKHCHLSLVKSFTLASCIHLCQMYNT